jgi:hypothetical protein
VRADQRIIGGGSALRRCATTSFTGSREISSFVGGCAGISNRPVAVHAGHFASQSASRRQLGESRKT